MGKEVLNLQLKFNDGSIWEVEPATVAESLASYYGKLDFDRGDYESEEAGVLAHYQDALSDGPGLIDWMKNHMNWEDLDAVMVVPPYQLDYAEEYFLSEVEIQSL